jgi:hypothetical protein
MVYFQTQKPNLGKFCRALQWKVMAYSMAIWCVFSRFGIDIFPFGHIFSRFDTCFPGFGMLYQEKSVNPANVPRRLPRTGVDKLHRIGPWSLPALLSR